MDKQNMDIAKYDEQKAELIKLVENLENVVIEGITDKTGYALAEENRKILQKRRIDITKEFKAERDVFTAMGRANREAELALIAIIEPAEKKLLEKKKAIDKEKERIARKESLPERKEKLEKIKVYAGDEFLLNMDDKQFNEYFNNERELYLENIEKKQQEEKERLEAENKRIEDEKNAEIERKRVEKEAQEKALRDAEIREKQVKIDAESARIKAEEDKKRAVKEAEEKAEKEKQAIIDEQKRKEQERLDEIEKEKQIKAEAEEKERLEKERLAKRQAYIDFLHEHNFVDGEDFKTEKKEDKVILYKKIGEFKL